MADIIISAVDLSALLDVTEGYTSEHGLDSVKRYADPAQVERALAFAKGAINEVRIQATSQ